MFSIQYSIIFVLVLGLYMSSPDASAPGGAAGVAQRKERLYSALQAIQQSKKHIQNSCIYQNTTSTS